MSGAPLGIGNTMDGARPDSECGSDSGKAANGGSAERGAAGGTPQGESLPDGSIERRRTLHDDRDEIESAVAELLEALGGLGFDEGSAFAVRLSVEEAINNGFRHGNKSDPSKLVHLHWRATPNSVQLEVRDEGEGFDPGAVPDPTAEENLEIPSGRGLMLMRAYMNEVEYVEPGNRVRMNFQRPPDEPAPEPGPDSSPEWGPDSAPRPESG